MDRAVQVARQQFLKNIQEPESHYESFLKRASSKRQSKSLKVVRQLHKGVVAEIVMGGQQYKLLPSAQEVAQARELASRQSVRSPSFEKRGDIARYVMQTLRPAAKTTKILSYKDYLARVETEYGIEQSVSRHVFASVIDAHPRHVAVVPDYLKKDLSKHELTRTPQIEWVQLVHDIDHIHLLYNPATPGQNMKAQAFPCIVRAVNFQQLSAQDSVL